MRIPCRTSAIRILVTMLTAALLAACAAGGSTVDRLAPGPYQVATNDSVALKDQIYARDLNLRVRYPAGAGTEKFPLIVFSHGAFCYPQQYANVTDFWVSHGYIVAFPDHLDSPNLGKIDPRKLAILLKSRVHDMSLVLDSIAEIETAVPELAGRIDTERQAVAGHSFGGMIAMVKSGLYMKESEQDPAITFADPRFDATVVLSGVGQMEQMADNAFDGLTGPLIASGGTLDAGNVGTGETYPWEWRMSPYTLAPPGDKYSIWLTDADHYMGGQICRDNLGGEDDPETARVVRAADLAFLDAYVKGDRRARRWLNDNDWAAISSNRATFAAK